MRVPQLVQLAKTTDDPALAERLLRHPSEKVRVALLANPHLPVQQHVYLEALNRINHGWRANSAIRSCIDQVTDVPLLGRMTHYFAEHHYGRGEFVLHCYERADQIGPAASHSVIAALESSRAGTSMAAHIVNHRMTSDKPVDPAVFNLAFRDGITDRERLVATVTLRQPELLTPSIREALISFYSTRPFTVSLKDALELVESTDTKSYMRVQLTSDIRRAAIVATMRGESEVTILVTKRAVAYMLEQLDRAGLPSLRDRMQACYERMPDAVIPQQTAAEPDSVLVGLLD